MVATRSAWKAIQRRTLTKLEVDIDDNTAKRLAGEVLVISVVRDIENFLPPAFDPVFRRRLRALIRSVSDVDLRATGPLPRTKVDAALATLPEVVRHRVAAVDIEAAGSCLLLRASDVTTWQMPGLPARTTLVSASHPLEDDDLKVDRLTAAVALLSLGERSESRAAVRSVVRVLGAACRGKEAGYLSIEIGPKRMTGILEFAD